MSTSPFGQPPAFGTPGPPPVPDAPVEVDGAKGRKTVLIAVAAGVVALGVLGGAAALVLGADPAGTTDTALPPAAVAPVDPSVAPSAPSTPLPTAVVQGRNVFVPLVDDEAAAGGEGGVVDPAAAPEPTAAPTSAPTGTTGGGTSGSGSAPSIPLPVPTVTVTQSTTLTEYLTDTELVRKLEQDIAALEAELALAEDDEDLMEDLQEEIARLLADLAEVRENREYEFDVFVLDVVSPDSVDSDVVFVLPDDTAPTGFTEYTVRASLPLEERTVGPQGELTLMTYAPPDPDDPTSTDGVVTFRYVSNVYRVVEGTALGFSRGPSPSPTPTPTPSPTP